MRAALAFNGFSELINFLFYLIKFYQQKTCGGDFRKNILPNYVVPRQQTTTSVHFFLSVASFGD